MGSIRWIPWDCHGRSTKVNGTVRGSFVALRQWDIHRRNKGMYSSRSLFLKVRAFVPFFVFFLLLLVVKILTCSYFYFYTVRLFKRFGRRWRGSTRKERHGVRFSREKVQNLFCYWYSRKQPGDPTMLCARGGVRRISHRARHVDVL